MEIDQPAVLDILDSKAPALSATSDMPVVETRPDSSPPEPEKKDEAVPVEQSTEAEPTAEDATAATDEQSGPPKDGVPKGVGKRLAELTKQRDEERSRALAAEERLNQALSALEKATDRVSPEPSAEQEPVRPNRNDFADPDAWDAAVMDYADKKAEWAAKREAERVRTAEIEKTRQEVVTRAQAELREAYRARTEKVAAKYEDYHQVAESPDVQVSMPMAVAILNHEMGPEIQYHLGKNPAEAARISAYQTRDVQGNLVPDAPRQIMELGLLAAKLTATPTPPPVTRAPKPIKPNTPSDTALDKDPNSMSMEEYASMRKKQMREARH